MLTRRAMSALLATSATWFSNLLNSESNPSTPPPKAPQRILISGTTGWIAGGVAKELVAAGHSVTGIARRPTTIDGVKSLQADLLSSEALSVIGKRDALLHHARF